jgi:hypothetical protein
MRRMCTSIGISPSGARPLRDADMAAILKAIEARSDRKQMINFFLLSMPIFSVIGVGWATTRARLVAQGALDSLSAFSFRFALPALLLRLIASLPSAGNIYVLAQRYDADPPAGLRRDSSVHACQRGVLSVRGLARTGLKIGRRRSCSSRPGGLKPGMNRCRGNRRKHGRRVGLRMRDSRL